jgi:hypothetical protein
MADDAKWRVPKERFPHFMEVPNTSAGDFKNYMKRAVGLHKFGAAVDIHPVSSLRNMRMFMTEDKKAGYAVTPEGELTSVWSHPLSGYRDVTRHAAEHAVLMAGATHLSSFDPALPEMYRKGGFQPIASTPWNEEYKPAGWNDELQGKPRVVYSAANRAVAKPEAKPYTKDMVLPELNGDNAYDEGMAEARAQGARNNSKLSTQFTNPLS